MDRSHGQGVGATFGVDPLNLCVGFHASQIGCVTMSCLKNISTYPETIFFVGAHKHIPGKPEVNVVDLCMCMYMFDMVGTYIRM